MTRADDDRLLQRLEAELVDPTRAPADGRITALREKVTDRAVPIESRSRRRRVILALGAAAVFIAGGVIGVLVADDLPRPVRRVASDIGLPVASPELVDAREELHRLGVALAAEDVDAVRDADTEMVRLVGELDPGERAEIEPVAHEVHVRAIDFLESRAG